MSEVASSDRLRVGAIDCGTNSIRLLVADLPTTGVGDGGPPLVEVHREMRVVRLGEGVDATGRLSPAAIDRTQRALTDYAGTLRQTGATRVRMAATSASRDADNTADFVAMVRDVLGQDPEVITGTEEAALSFTGAVGELDPATGPFLVVDIGGGSTELVTGERVAGAAGGLTTRLFGAISIDLGCVRLTERLLHSDPPTASERGSAVRWVREQLSRGLDAIPLADGAGTVVRRFVPVAGTATTVAAAALGLTTYDADRIHLSTVGFDRTREVAEFFLGATRADRAALGYMHPGRVDVIGGGALILAILADLVAERTGLQAMTVSEHDILDGLALSLG
ncbi:Ppx/GppA family phosphatase [Nakamurella flava]|uniref:Ppx/GppA family phosphatase n=1 Tax=Nakamurella flava TaxID=2576308 RepID=A0A4U6QM55_9ACTN|nr:Ppx/GppA family phosphatase [Nakamurella flava]